MSKLAAGARVHWTLTFLAMTSLEGLWRTLWTTPPLPAPSSHMGSKSSSLSSPTWAFWVRKASRRFLCCSSKSNSPNFLCKASRLALKRGGKQDQVWHNVTYAGKTWVCRKVSQTRVRCSKLTLYTYSAAASMVVDCPSPVGVIIKGTGLLFGAIPVSYLFQWDQVVSGDIQSFNLLHKAFLKFLRFVST